METTLVGQLSDDQIQQLKNDNPGGIFSLEVDGNVGYFKNPGRKEMNATLAQSDKDAPLKMYEFLARIIWLKGGSELLLSDDQLFYGVVDELRNKMNGKKAVLKNL